VKFDRMTLEGLDVCNEGPFSLNVVAVENGGKSAFFVNSAAENS